MAPNREQYAKYRMTKIESACFFQDFIVELFATELNWYLQPTTSRAYQYGVGETRQGVEIKHDERYVNTGNLWIELQEKAYPRPGPYVESGINKKDNRHTYVIGDYDTVFVYPILILQLLAQNPKFKHIENGTKTSIGFLLPHDKAVQWAQIILHPKQKKKVSKYVRDLETLSRELQDDLLDVRRQYSLFGDVKDPDDPEESE